MTKDNASGGYWRDLQKPKTKPKPAQASRPAPPPPAFEPQPVTSPKPVKTVVPFKLVPLQFPELYAIEGGVLFGPTSINEPPGSYHYPGGIVMHSPVSINEPLDTPTTSPSPGPGTGGPGPGEPAPIVISMSGSMSFPEGSANGTPIGTLSATGGTPGFTFSLTDNAGGRFKLVGNQVQVGALSSADGSYTITAHAVDTIGATADKNFTITANAVLEPVDNPTQASTLRRIKNAIQYAKFNNPVNYPDWGSDPVNQGVYVTVTRSNSHDAALTIGGSPGANAALFQHSPGNRYIFAGGLLVGAANQLPATGTDLSGFAGLTTPDIIPGDEQNCYTADFRVTNATKIEIGVRRFVPDTNPYRLILNKRYLARDGFLGAGGDYITLEFTYPFDGLVTLECQGAGMILNSVAVDAAARVGPIMDPQYRMLVLGDSITEGRSTGDAIKYSYERWGSVAAKCLGMNLLRNAGVGQTGYTNDAGGVHKKLVGQLPEVWASGEHYDIIGIANGVNDFQSFPTATVTADALLAWQAIRTAQPNALIVVLGIWGCSFGPSATLIAVENALKAKFDTWADPFSVFIPVSTDPAGPWMYGTGNVGAPTGDGNADIYSSSDGLHPSRAGGVYCGQKLDAALRAKLPAMFTAFGVADEDTWVMPAVPALGVNTHGGRMNQTLGEPVSQAEHNEAADTLGFQYVRSGMEWYNVEKTAGTFSFGFYVDQFTGLKERGVKPLVTLAYGNPVHTAFLDHDPWWVFPPRTAPEIAAWKIYCGKVAEVFGPDVPYEVWNEENSDFFWHEFASSSEYMVVFNAAAQAVRSVHPNAHMMIGGVVGVAGALGEVQDADQFLRECLNSPGHERIDSVAYHYYTTGDLAPWDTSAWNFIEPSQNLHCPERIIDWVPELRSDLTPAAGGASVPIVSSECGYPITQSMHYSSERQAVLNSRLMLSGIIAGVQGIHNIYDMIDDANNIYDPQGGYGQYDFGFTIKPSGLAYAQVTKALKGATGPLVKGVIGAASVYPGQVCYIQVPKADRIVAICWSNGVDPTPYTYTFPSAVTSSTAKDLYGNTVDKAVSGSTVTVKLCNAYGPVYIEVNGPNNAADRNSINICPHPDNFADPAWEKTNLTTFDSTGFTANATDATDFFGTKKAMKYLAAGSDGFILRHAAAGIPNGTYRVELDVLYNPQWDAGIGNFVEGAPFIMWLTSDGTTQTAVTVNCKRGWQRVSGTWTKASAGGATDFLDIRAITPHAVMWIANPLITAAL